MKRKVLTLAVASLALTASVLALNGVFGYVKVTPQGEDIILQWRTLSESGIQSFEIERKSEDVPDFRRLTKVTPKGGASTYTFVDNGAFYKPQGGKLFTYRLKAVTSSGEIYSPPATVVHEVSSVKRSWGMIKELFR